MSEIEELIVEMRRCLHGPAKISAIADALKNGADALERMSADLADARVSICAFAGPAAAEYAKAFGLDGLHPHHYDILEKAGARMTDFKRAALQSDNQGR